MNNRGSDFFRGLLLGGLIGAVAGLLLAPKSGRELRADISERADELISVAREEYEKGMEKGKRIYASAKDQAGEIQGKIGDLTEKGKEKVEETSSRFKTALDAGIQAYKEAKEKEQ